MKLSDGINIALRFLITPIASLVIPLVVGCATVTAPPTDSNMPIANFPAMSLGDSWVFSQESSQVSKGGKYKETVVEVNEDGSFVVKLQKGGIFSDGSLVIELRKGGTFSELYYDNNYRLYKYKNSQNGKVVLKKKPLRELLNFPLYVGKTWRDSFTAKSIHGMLSDYNEIHRVMGYEKIQIKAGVFNTFKIKRTTYFAHFSGPMFISYYWYSPKLKVIIKETAYSYGDTELASYNLGAPMKKQEPTKPTTKKLDSQPTARDDVQETTNDIKVKLLKLKDLLDNGLITKDDYDKKKSELLENF